MTTSDYIAFLAMLISFGALLVSGFSWWEARKANKSTLHNTKTFFDAHISSARDKVRNMNLLLVAFLSKNELTEEEKKTLVLYQKIKVEVQEEYLNALNQACNAYIAGKMDKDVFLLEYKDDITRVYKSEEYKKLLQGNTENYSAITKFIKKEQIVSI